MTEWEETYMRCAVCCKPFTVQQRGHNPQNLATCPDAAMHKDHMSGMPIYFSEWFGRPGARHTTRTKLEE